MNKPKTTDSWLKRVMDMADAFRYSRILLTAVELDLFTHIGKESLPAAVIARKLKTNPRATETILNALVGLRLLKKHNRLFSNTPESGSYLDRASEAYRGAFLAHAARFWYPWEQLTRVVKTGRQASSKRAGTAADFAWAMYHSGLERAEQVLSLLEFKNIRRALDLGGGPGHYAVAIARRNPDCRVAVFDRPGILEVTRQVFALHPELKDRLDTLPGDFLKDNIGDGYDLIIASNIIHSYGEREVKKIIQKATKALAPKGLLVINDFLLDESRTEPEEAAVFSVHMLVLTETGRCYSATELSEWFEASGLTVVGLKKVGAGPFSLLIGRKD